MSNYTADEIKQALKREKIAPDNVFEQMMAHPELIDMDQKIDNNNLLFLACGSSVRAVEFFLRYFPINCIGREGRMPLIKAIYSNNAPVVELLLGRMTKDDINHRDSYGFNALHIAERAFKEIIPVLLPYISSEDINPVDEVIFSPIEMPRMGRLMTVDYLLPSFVGRPTNDLVLVEAGKATEIIRGDN